MKKITNIFKAIAAAALLVTVIILAIGFENSVVHVAITLLASGLVIFAMCVGDEEENPTITNETDHKNSTRYSGFSENHAIQMVQEQIRINDEITKQHVSFAEEATKSAAEEAQKAATPFSLGGNDLAYDIAVSQNHSFFSDSFNSFGGFGDIGGLGF